MAYKLAVFVDCEDIVVNSSETAIKILNERYNCDKTEADLKDEEFKSIAPLREGELEEIFSSWEYSANLCLQTEFDSLYRLFGKEVEWYFLYPKGAKGESIKTVIWNNIVGKKRAHFLELPSEGFLSEIKMLGAVYITGNNRRGLKSTAPVRIVLQRGMEKTWNAPVMNGDLYILYDWSDLIEAIAFFKNHPQFLR